MERKSKFNFKEPIYKLMYLYIGILSTLALISCLVIGLVINNYSIIWACLINFPFITIAIVLNVILNTFIASCQGKKATVSTIAVFLYITKYIILLLGLIIGIIVDTCVDWNIFNIYTLAACALIYPLGAIISTIHLSIIERKKDKEKKKEVHNEASSYLKDN